MPLDDGYAPLLPQRRRPEITLPSGKLGVIGALLGCSILIDGLLCAYVCTGGFSSDWWRRLGLGHGAYPFGSAGLDLLLLGLVRPLVAAGGCLFFFISIKRSSLEKCNEVGHDQFTPAGDLGSRNGNGHILSPSIHSNSHNGAGGGGGASRFSGHEGGNTQGDKGVEDDLERGCDEYVQEGGDRDHAYEMPRVSRWLEFIGPTGCFLGLLLLITKCSTRFIAGPGSGSDFGLSTGWFWASIGWSTVASVGQILLATGFTSTCRRYWLLHYCRETGDVDSALEEGRKGREGGRKGNKKGEHFSTFGDVLGLCADEMGLVLFACVALLLASFSQVLIPHFTGNMIDIVIGSGDQAAFKKSTVYLILASTACGVFSGLRGGIFSVVGAGVNVTVRQRLFESLARQEIGFFDTMKTGDLMSRLAGDCTKIGDQVMNNVNVFLRNIVMVVVALLFMVILSWRLSLVAFTSVPAVVVISTWYDNYINEIAKSSQDKLAEAGAVAEQSLSSMNTVRSFAAEGRECKEYAKKLQEFYALSKKAAYGYSLYAGSVVLLPSLVTAAVVFYGGTLVTKGEITGGKLVSFMIYLTLLSDSFNQMAAVYSAMTQAVGAADKVFELMKREPKGATPPPSPPLSPPLPLRPTAASAVAAASVATPTNTTATPATSWVGAEGSGTRGGAAPKCCRGEVELRDVEFEYPSRPGNQILDGISFKASAGQVVALVGPSGGGKSSCIALLENLYQPSTGQVMLDGIPVHEYNHHWLHQSVSIVGQEPTLYARSIRENIIYGLEEQEPSMEDVEEAAKLANAHAFISQLPDKYETQAGERGVQMSGGQKQRIAIARALVRKPRVLLLDEATSALDAESEHFVQQAIDDMIARGGMTVILIAHRLSTVKRADKICVIQEGKVAEEGTHEELLSTKGSVYSALVKRQLDIGDCRGMEDFGASTVPPNDFETDT